MGAGPFSSPLDNGAQTPGHGDQHCSCEAEKQMNPSGISSTSQGYREARVTQHPAQLRTAPKISWDFSSSVSSGALSCLTRDSPTHSPGSSSLPKSSSNKCSSFFKKSA